MGAYLNLFNNREKAMAVWLAVGLVWMFLSGRTRPALQQLLRSFFQWKILLIVLAMLLYVGLEIFCLRSVGFWDTSLLKDTILWTLGVAFVLLVNSGTPTQDEHYFRKVLLDNVKMVALLEFIVNLYTFNFWVEIILVPVLFLFGGISAVAASDKKYLAAKKLFDFVITVFGLYLLGFTIVSIVHDIRVFASMENLRSFLLPIFLSLGYLPFLYAFILYASYETLSVRLSIFLRDNRSLARYAKRKIFEMCFLNLRRLDRFMNYEDAVIDLMNLKDRDDVVRLIQEGRKRGF